MSAARFVAGVWVLSLQASVVLAAAAVLVRLGRRWAPALRLRILQAALAAALLAPMAGAWMNRPAEGGAPIERARLSLVSSAASAGVLATRPAAAGVAAAVIGAGCLARLLLLAIGQRRLRRGAAAPVDPTVAREADAEQVALGTRARIDWRADIDSPSTFGRWPAIVLLPASLAAADATTRRAVVCHELLHVRRGDWSAVVVEELLRAAFWFHPGVHWAIAEMRLAREQLVDRDVVTLTGARGRYLELLLAYGDAPAVAAAASPFFGRRQLERRIRHLTEETTMTRRYGMVVAASVLALGTSVAAAGAMFPLSGEIAARADGQGQPGQNQQGSAADEKTLPKVIHEVAAVYPAEAKRARVEGSVYVDVTVDVDGRVTATRVTQSIPMLDDAAEDALRQWLFEPGKVNGEPVKVTVSVEVRFTLR